MKKLSGAVAFVFSLCFVWVFFPTTCVLGQDFELNST